MYERLLKAFGTEMGILHQVNMEELQSIAGEKVAAWIIKDRYGELIIEAGGGEYLAELWTYFRLKWNKIP